MKSKNKKEKTTKIKVDINNPFYTENRCGEILTFHLNKEIVIKK